MSFNTALSGINAASKALDVTGNNIANSGTVGFKGSRAEFSDVYNYNAYGVARTAVGGGVSLSRVSQSFATGQIYGTTGALDLAINGSGFFILNDQGSKAYSRAGQFGVNKQDFIVNSSGQNLTGLLADDSGNITGVSGDLKITRADIKPKSTTDVQVGSNLYAKTTPVALDWAGGASPAASTFNNTTSTTIYDSLGNSHVLSTYFIKADPNALAGDPNAASPPGALNQWYVAFQIDNVDIPAVTVGGQNTNNLYRANFNGDGSFSSVQDPAGNPLAGNLIALSAIPNNGADPINFNIDLSKSTQFGSPFAIQSVTQDGYTSGSLEGLNIDVDGVVFGRYSNGQARAVGQIQLANFADPQGLQNIGGTSWAETSTSGQPLISAAGTGGLGYINSGNLEDSNVDLTGELVNLITEQRNFQANAQTIRTGDAITQTIINIR